MVRVGIGQGERSPQRAHGRNGHAGRRCFVALLGFIGGSLFLVGGPVRGQTSDSPCIAAPTLPITGTRIVNVATEAQLQSAIGTLRDGDTLVLAPGTYALTKTLYVSNVNDVTIRGVSGCQDTVLVGRGMDNASYGNVPHGIWSNARNTVLAHLTIRDVYTHAVIFNAGAQSPRVYHVKLLDAGSQFIKANPNSPTDGVNNGLVEYSVFAYTTGPSRTDHGPGIGYTNGLSLHTVDHWIIRGNLFKNFHTPDGSAYPWNPVVLVWNHSKNTLTERNTFINVDRAIAYGLQDNTGSDHQGGIIRNNFIYLQPGLMSPFRKASSDAQIIVWDSPGTAVFHNTILTNGNVFRSIEGRFNTAGTEIRNNLTDAPLGSRDGGEYHQSGNLLTATASMFINATSGDLHLHNTASAVIDKAPTLTSVREDIDGHPRPSGAAYDIGADELVAGGSGLPQPAPLTILGATSPDQGW